MALDGIFLRYIKHEIETEALGARVSQIYQPNRDELVFAMRTFNGNKKLLLSARANSPRVHFAAIHLKIPLHRLCFVCFCVSVSAAESWLRFVNRNATECCSLILSV